MAQMITHNNLIQKNVNDVENEKGYEIFCKRRNKVFVPMETDCSTCRHFSGFMMGYGISCTWRDVPPEDGSLEVVIPWENRNLEYLRVSKLISEGDVKKG